MNIEPYDRFESERLILRDELAIDRTILANERTLLAYARTGLAMILAGVTFIHFSNAIWFTVFGAVSMVTGTILALWGGLRYRKMKQSLASIRAKRNTSH